MVNSALLRLNLGVSMQQAFAAVQSHDGDLNALTPYGTLLLDSSPASVQTVLTPGNYVALNATGNGDPAPAPFTVTQSPSPAALPAASATETAVDLGFQGPTVLHNGTIVRAQNHGWPLIEARNVCAAREGRADATGLRRSELRGLKPEDVQLVIPGQRGRFGSTEPNRNSSATISGTCNAEGRKSASAHYVSAAAGTQNGAHAVQRA